MPSEDPAAARRTNTPFTPSGLVALVQNMLGNFGRWGLAVWRAPRAGIPRLPVSAIAAISVTLIVVVASMFLVDAAASNWARRELQWSRNAFEQITCFGLSGWFLIPCGCILLGLAAAISPALSRLSQGVLAVLAARFGFLFLAIGAPGLFDAIVKRLIGRARPDVSHDNPFAYMPFIWRPEYASMPSGHATTAAAAAVAIGAIWPRGRGIMWLYALVIMFSRVAILAHYASDVIAGALIGVVGAVLVRRWFAARRLVFSPIDLGAYPRPSLKRVKVAIREVLEHCGCGENC